MKFLCSFPFSLHNSVFDVANEVAKIPSSFLFLSAVAVTTEYDALVQDTRLST